MVRYDGQSSVPGAPGNSGGLGGALAQRIYGQIERGQYNRPGPRGAGIVQPEVFMAPYPGTKPGQPTEYFPLGNPAAGYRFEAKTPTANQYQVAQALPGEAGNLGGMQASSLGPPIRFGADVQDGTLQNVRGNVNTQLDENQRMNFGGNYNLQNQSGNLNVGYQTPTFGLDVNFNRSPRGYGVGGNITGRW
jgi:hypothetical protein